MSACCTSFDRPSFYSITSRTARKPHRCCECGYQIKPKEAYRVVSGKWEGDVSSHKQCERCADLSDSLSETTCVYIGGLFDNYEEYLEAVCDDYDEVRSLADQVEKKHREFIQEGDL